MTEWRATARLNPDRWVAWDGRDWNADEVTAVRLHLLDPFGPVPMTPVGPVYTPNGPADPAALLLNAIKLLPGGAVVDGEAPELPPIPPVPDGAVA